MIFCSAKAWIQHLHLLKESFKVLLTVGLTLKPSKVQFGPAEVEYLGHVIWYNEIKIGDDRIQAVADLPHPTSIDDLRSVLGAFNLVRT